MPCSVTWAVIVEREAGRGLRRIPQDDLDRIETALVELANDPFAGDVLKLQGSSSFRKRVGSYRILFDLNFDLHRVEVTDIARRTSTIY